MRLSLGTLRRVVKQDLPIAFVQAAHFVWRSRTAAPLGGDYGGGRLALLLLALPYVGARRLEHLQYLVGDPLVRRFAGLARVPTARTVSNWPQRFTQETLRPLVRLNQELVLETLARLDVPRLTLDVDGTIVRTGATVAWGLSRLQSASPEGPQLLSAARPRRADRPHPAGQEPPGQRARLQAVRGIPPRTHRRGSDPPGPTLAARAAVTLGLLIHPHRTLSPPRNPGSVWP
jgi:hypothetical protein